MRLTATPAAIAALLVSSSYDVVEAIRVMVHYKNDAGRLNAIEAGSGTILVDIPSRNIVTIDTTEEDVQDLEANENILEVEEDLMVLPDVLPDDFEKNAPRHLQEQTQRANQSSSSSSLRRSLAEAEPFGLAMVQADQLSMGPNPVKVCVVDTGYGLGHPDLPNNQHGIDGFTDDAYVSMGQSWNVDGHSHGTHCAGTIGAIGGNDEGVNSVNPDPTKFTFFIGKGLSDSGWGYSSSVLDAVEECAAAGAKIISMSLGSSSFSSIAQETYRNVVDQDVLIIAAAGNTGNSNSHYPASYDFVMSVAAVDAWENKAYFSTYNDQVEIAAPGVHVLSTVTTGGGTGFGYATKSGTSMACPHVAGVAALVWSHFPDCTNNQIRNVLVRTAKDKGAAGCESSYGFGIVQAKAAYDLLVMEGCTAGGEVTEPLSSGSFGGCDQDPDYTQPPTVSPTTAAPTVPQPPIPTPPPVDVECQVKCCYPGGNWANDYMKGICESQGCQYTLHSNGHPYCSISTPAYWDCMDTECGEDETTEAPTKAPTKAPETTTTTTTTTTTPATTTTTTTTTPQTTTTTTTPQTTTTTTTTTTTPATTTTTTAATTTTTAATTTTTTGGSLTYVPGVGLQTYTDKWGSFPYRYGTMFEITAKKNVKITNFAIHTGYYASSNNYEVWTKAGTYTGSDTNLNGWTNLWSPAMIPGVGSGVLVELPSPFTSVEIAAGEIQSFYITGHYNYYAMKLRGGTVEHQEFKANDDLAIHEGFAINHYPIESRTGFNHAPIRFDGKIYYDVAA